MKCKLGDLIELSNETNSDGKFGADDVKGMTITKKIIPTKAKVKDTDISKFLVVQPNQFVYNPRTHGAKIGLGFNDTIAPFIISWNNTAFRVKDLSVLNPTYLYMYFNRDEWDRKAVFDSWGSSTEVFSWGAMCDMEIDLPPIDIQDKYVAIYKSLLDNQQAYASGTDDLKLVCDATIEKLRRELPNEKIGNYIELLSDKNENLKYDVNSVRGISTKKEFISTKAKMEGVSLSSYRVVEPLAFAFVADTSRRGEKISMAFNDSKESYLVSSISTVFKVSKSKSLNPSFLSMFIRRTEFDRYARFHSWGSARETFTWDDLKEVKIPIPSIDIQNSIVDIYNSFILRRKINDKLRAQIQNICPILVSGSIKEVQTDAEI
ncbi:MAG: restriction endonuclease subunit S [Leuconostoc mesenteroides]